MVMYNDMLQSVINMSIWCVKPFVQLDTQVQIPIRGAIIVDKYINKHWNMLKGVEIKYYQ